MASLLGLSLAREEKKARRESKEVGEKKIKQLPHECDQISGPCFCRIKILNQPLNPRW